MDAAVEKEFVLPAPRPDVLRAPLLPLAIGLAAGIAVDDALALPTAVAVVLMVAGAAGFRVSPRHALGRFALLGLAAAGVGAMLHDVAFRHVAPNHVVRCVGAAPRLARLTGTVATKPVVTRPDAGPFARWLRAGPRTRLLLEAEQLETASGPTTVVGPVLVYIRTAHPGLAVGDRVEIHGWLRRLESPGNPATFDWAKRQRRRGVLVAMRVKHAAAVRSLGRAPLSLPDRMLAALRNWPDPLLPDNPHADSLLQTMILGQRSAVDRSINDAFLQAGAAHFLAVSGIHVGLLGMFVWFACGLAGVSRRPTAVVVVVVVLLYACLADARPSVLRATVMIVLAMTSVVFRRPLATGNWIAVAAILLLVWHPTDLFDVGFQLSFACIIAVIYVCSHVLATIRRVLGSPPDDVLKLMVLPSGWWPRVLPRVTGDVLAALSTTISAWLVAAPLAALHFGRFAPLGWLYSLLLLFPAMVVMFAGFAVLLIPGAFLFTPVLDYATRFLIALAETLSRWPGAQMDVPSPPSWWVALYLVAVGAWTWRASLRLPRSALAALATITLSTFLWWALSSPRDRDAVLIHVLAVGDGSAIVIELPDGQTLLYDAGSLDAYDVGARVVLPLLRQRRIDKIDAAIVTHPNLDHFSGLLSIREHVPVREWLLPPQFDALSRDRSPSRFFLDELVVHNAAVRHLSAGQPLLDADAVTIDVLWPPGDETAAGLRANDVSIVLRVSYAGRSVLLCGDIQQAAELALLDRADLRADVLVLPHHGSVERTTEAFIEAVSPQTLIRSSGQHDRETFNGLLALVKDRTYYNTADDGAVTIRLAPDGVTVTPFRPRPR